MKTVKLRIVIVFKYFSAEDLIIILFQPKRYFRKYSFLA